MTRRGVRDGKVSTDAADSSFGSNPFGTLSGEGLRKDVSGTGHAVPDRPSKNPIPGVNGQRLDVRREKAGRGGKTVTTVTGFPPCISRTVSEAMLREIKKRLGTGGSLVDGHWELQGDRRKEVVAWLLDKGFAPVLAGG